MKYPTAAELRGGVSGKRRTRTPAERLGARYEVEPGGCWRWTGSKTTQGYGHFSIRSVYYQAHRLLYILHRGPVTTEHLDHLCRNRWCVNPWHLEPVSAAVNVQRGSQARLNPEKVARIRRSRAAGMGVRQLARLYGVNHATVSRIVNGLIWKDEPVLAEKEAA